MRDWGELERRCRKLMRGDQKEADREHQNKISQLGVILSWARKEACQDPKEILEEIKAWNPR